MSGSVCWYRCTVCDYRYTPQQFQALAQLRAFHTGEAAERLMEQPELVPCRNRGCEGRLARTDLEYRDAT